MAILESNSSSGRTPATLRIGPNERGSSLYAPLDLLHIEGRVEGPTVLRILDGAGCSRLCRVVEGDFSFTHRVGGALGWHRICLETQTGDVVFERSFRVDASTALSMADPGLMKLWSALYGSIGRNRRTVLVDGVVVPYFFPWIRDDTHVQKASVYWHADTGTWAECFLARQTESGMLHDYARAADLNVERMEVFGPAFYRLELENGLRWERLPSEADVEYLAVENVYRAWQASGDDEHLRGLLPKLEAALDYSMSDPLRWSSDHGLVKRPYTIDTWDFKFFGFTRDHITDETSLQEAVFNVRPDTPMCVMHGDNSGMYQACSQLAVMWTALSEADRAGEWAEKAAQIRARTNEHCWNGEYYDHWVPVTPLGLDEGGVDGAKSLTLSNAYNLNRGIGDHAQCASIIRKYQQLREDLRETHFAEWLSAYPCWPKGFSGVPAGRYVNGGVLTIVAGELARGAFAHGFEAYGADILARLVPLLENNPEERKRDHELFVQPYLYCGYTPDGKETGGIPDTWGQAAVVAAFVEGLAGVVDRDRRFARVTVSPRWAAAGVDQARVTIRYPASDGYVSYRFEYLREEGRMELLITGNADDWRLEILAPQGFKPVAARRNGEPCPFTMLEIEESTYAIFDITGPVGDMFAIELSAADSA